MASGRSSLPDEVHGARATGALLVGELDAAVEALRPASNLYLAGFFLRFSLISPGLSLRLAWRVARQRFESPSRGITRDGSPSAVHLRQVSLPSGVRT